MIYELGLRALKIVESRNEWRLYCCAQLKFDIFEADETPRQPD